MVYSSGPFNIQQGNDANFVVEFLDSNGVIVSPASATITVTYTNTSNVQQSDSVALSQTGSFYNGTWSSTSASLGLATWVAASAGSTTTLASGQLRIIDRQV